MSFGRAESNLQLQIQSVGQSNVHSNIVNYTESVYPTAEGILSSQEILDQIGKHKTKNDDHMVNHLPVTYSILKESEEYLQKYGLGRKD